MIDSIELAGQGFHLGALQVPSPVPTSGMVDRQVARNTLFESVFISYWELSLGSDANAFLGTSLVQREVFIDYHFFRRSVISEKRILL